MNLNGTVARPWTTAEMLRASTAPSRDACCAVGGWNEPFFATSGIRAQSPSAHTSGWPGTRRSASTTILPFSLGSPIRSRVGLGEVPAVQTSVYEGMFAPSLSETSRAVTPETFVLAWISTPRARSCPLA